MMDNLGIAIVTVGVVLCVAMLCSAWEKVRRAR
jgi:hypothetical protein